MKKKIFRFLSLIIFLFIFINIALSFLWPYLTEFNMNSKTYYSDSILKSIEISREEESDFYKETWSNRKFNYVQFVDQYENTPKNQKFVNADPKNGRKIENNKNCIKNFIFYGSSQTFGYNVKDNQTIAAKFKNILDKNYKDYCVYNFGSASHFSTQETIFFITHLLKNKIKKNDFIFFIDGMTERGNKQTRFSNYMQFMYKYFNLKYWNKYYFTSSLFFESLPVVQLYKRISQKNTPVNTDRDVDSDYLKKETIDVFQNNILIRRGICQELEINCYTFLQPFPPNFRVQFRNELLKKTEYLIDISALLSNEKELSYVDEGHYSPESSMRIANSIFSIIIEDLE